MSGKKTDITGQKFGKLTVIKFNKIVNHNPHWLCKCNCGNIKSVQRGCLISGQTRSCGCLRKERKLTLGGKHASLYRVWHGMKQRCNNKQCYQYKDWGGRGIKICTRWLNFENFYNDVGDKPKELSLDRIDNDGNYCKENCRWATRKDQQRNTRNNYLITYKGKTKCLAEWSEILEINRGTLWCRINIYNWSIKRAFTT